MCSKSLVVPRTQYHTTNDTHIRQVQCDSQDRCTFSRSSAAPFAKKTFVTSRRREQDRRIAPLWYAKCSSAIPPMTNSTKLRCSQTYLRVLPHGIAHGRHPLTQQNRGATKNHKIGNLTKMVLTGVCEHDGRTLVLHLVGHHSLAS